MSDYKNILVIDFGGIGDLVLSIPFLRGLKSSFHSCEVSVLCADRTGGILRNQPYIDNLYMSSITLLSLLSTCLKLRKKNFDIAVNLMPKTSFFSAIKMWVLFILIKAKLWAGRDTEGRGFFYDIRVWEEKMQMKNEVSLYGRVFRAIG